MLGAIIGDLVGSVYEFDPIKRKDFEPLLHPRAFFTDDSVLTIAVADALLHGRDLATSLKEWGRRYPDANYGARFARWLFSDETAPYGSYGNGAAMRCAPAAWLARNLDEALRLAQQTAAVTHDHPEGIKGAQTTVLAIWLARQGLAHERIRAILARFSGYDLTPSVDMLRPDYRFDETCQGSVPAALVCALEADSFEDAIRNAVSLGGDADTLAAIAGSVAEALFGIPEGLRAEVLGRLPAEIVAIVDELYTHVEDDAASGPQACSALNPARFQGQSASKEGTRS